MSDDEAFPALVNGGGALRDPFDKNDQYYVPDNADEPRPRVDLREDHADFMTRIYDQGTTQTCTANAAAAALWYEEKAGRHSADWGEAGPSRLFIYWLARGGMEANFSQPEDTGSFMRDAMTGMADHGACPENDCPFPDFASIDAKVKGENLTDLRAIAKRKRQLQNDVVNKRPEDVAFKDALKHKIATYWRLDADRPEPDDKNLTIGEKAEIGKDTLYRVKKCLSEGFPVAFSFWYFLPYNEMYQKKPGEMFVLKDVWNDPDASDKGVFPRHTWIDDLDDTHRPRGSAGQPLHRGHSVLAIGYDDAKEQILVQNSLGEKFSKGGFFLMPYAWISDFAATNDFWTIRMAGDIPKAAPMDWKQINKYILKGLFGDDKA